jgi:hypothetical protein
MGSLLICRSEFQISHNLAISLALVSFLSFFLSVRMLQGRKEGRGSLSLCSHRLRLAERKKERKKGKKETWYT